MLTDLILDAVAVSFGRKQILKDVSAILDPGGIHVVLGPNGAGKSTLLKAVAGVVALSAGTVRLGTEELPRMTPVARARRVAYVPQQQAVALPLSVRDALHAAAYSLQLSGIPAHAIETGVTHALERLQIQPLADEQVSRLSGGEWRRVMLAQALVQLNNEPGVLLLDEPSAFLDPPARYEIMALARYLAGSGFTVVVAMHEIQLAAGAADSVLLLRQGKVLAAGPPAILSTGLLCELYECFPAQLGMQGVHA